MRASLHDANVRAVYLAALREHGIYDRAAAAAGITGRQSLRLRGIDAGFAAACAMAIGTLREAVPARQVRLSASRLDRFLAHLGITGSVGRSCAAAGISPGAVYIHRRADPDFAARWADARNMAIDRVEDLLFDAALNGFTRIDARGGMVRTQQAAAMFRLLGRRERGGSGGVRVVELTPAVIEAARAKFDRHLRIAAASGTVPDYVVAMPPPTVTAG